MAQRQNHKRSLRWGLAIFFAIPLLVTSANSADFSTGRLDRDAPILTSDDFFQEIGDYYRVHSNTSNASVSGLLGTIGGPQTWDFTTGPTGEIKRFDYVATDDGDDPGAGFFAGDHYALADFSQRMTEEIGGGQAWMYLDQIAAQGRTNYGYFWPDGNASTDDWSVFTPPILDFPDPLAYGDNWLLSTTYQFQMWDTMVLDIRIDLTINAEADAWGTVILPNLGPIDAIRINTEQTSAVYVWIDQWYPVSTQYNRIYDWIGVDSDLIVEIVSTVSETGMPPDNFTIASSFVRQFENSNPTAAPVIAPIPDHAIFETYTAYTYDVESSGIPDPSFALLAAPEGMTIDEVTGMINWTPTSVQVGENTVTVEADNGNGTDTETFVITLYNLNEPPQNLFTDLFDNGTTTLSWDPPASTYWLNAYNIYHSTSIGGPYSLQAQAMPEDLSIEFASPGFSQSNYYVVTAELQNGFNVYQSIDSNEVLAYSLGPGESGCSNDDGTAESGIQAGGLNGELSASLDLPSAEELTLTKVAVYFSGFSDAPVTMKVAADDAGGFPGSTLAQAQYPASMLRAGWNILEIPEFMQPSFTGGSFFIGLVEGVENNTVGHDESQYGHSFTKAPGGAWSFMFSGELMFGGIVEGEVSGIEEPASSIPSELALSSYPAPFKDRSQIRYELPEAGPLSLRIYSVSGRLVRELVQSERHNAGSFMTQWNGRDNAGRHVVSGTYFYQLKTRDLSLTERVVLAR
ncbi:MAG: T9SS type A sorting domain-containing protein [Candidatus Eisenbacteria bacterium]|uniref:T9SS type A sorting domain-containing protein n=1 Tax=Eiseniibacteriota bacterium TaxID=2212470 RepID=A0A948RXV0_UNCEI|nr:T9SS type A sorting domain-containing protein [Candidatus Eisenbacteria bacterium]MBU1949642.1 T9SS type A sorting domain-containing protein [Candidatus Eisenbacteria bacterium]MBU2693035.1 T9SS type A sorting domain-containing protein [Candidatus Eisenbacteria bacterium]